MVPTRDRRATGPWRLRLTGRGVTEITPGTREALANILNLLPELPAMIIHTQHGTVEVSREFSDDHIRQIDRTIAGVFKKAPSIDAIEFPGHTATRENPDLKSSGKQLREIVLKAKAGELSRDVMRDLLSTMFNQKRDTP